ncbi:MarR family winged helix-turn-helix transcriptional regulator [Paenibacillus mendelii]|uniref:MarR family winged helix-turn-helix transcriptional regulator n=1 Tax=Paenibacillus mendelii TaxID=206163 RepID=A0ABV6J3B1_9BACL|nr:MarR family transcriptional regulator [Paenibacillus mendelii]MCQ6559391.1 MarR family transcriptional regulator [Paenibacillus mendelii]
MPSNDPSAIDVIHVLVRTTHYIQREFTAQISSLDLPFHISGPRLRLLSIVSEAGKIRMSELAAKLGIAARTVTDFVDALEKDNLLIRIPDPTDRRATLLQLTELAQANISQALAIQAEIAEKLIENLSPEQRKQLLDLFFLLIEEKDLSDPCESLT